MIHWLSAKYSGAIPYENVQPQLYGNEWNDGSVACNRLAMY